jgi:uncharacterized protein (DUF362 family)
MTRREFLRSLASAGAVAGGALMFGLPGRLFAQQSQRGVAGQSYDIVALMNASPERMFDRGMAELGGMRSFVGRNETVAIKPNMSWSTEPEVGATTSPALVKRIVEHCIDAGARKVYVFDHPLDSWKYAYETNKIGPAVRDAGGTIVPGHTRGYYQEVTVTGAEVLKTTEVHEMVLDADVLINVPILKHHGSTKVTCALKNLMGVVWNRRFYHARGLNQCIADFPLVRKPDLNVVDAYRVLKSGGPRGSSYRAKVQDRKMQIISTDIVAADAAAAKTWGTEPDSLPYVTMAHDHGLGTMDLDALRIKRIAL